MSVTGMALRVQIGRMVRDTRVAIGWTQAELARRARTAQSTISRIETVKLEELTLETAGAVLGALGVRVSLDLRAPFLADRGRQRDAGHARCIAYVARRLERLGWITLTEVEVVAGTARGWIDILAFRASDGMLLVIEVKTELSDVGLIQRQVAWYVRSAWRTARQQGWCPARALGALLVLATDRNVERIADNRELLSRAFPIKLRDLTALVTRPPQSHPSGTAMALIDAYERSRRWLLPVARGSSRYADYADFASRLPRRSTFGRARCAQGIARKGTTHGPERKRPLVT